MQARGVNMVVLDLGDAVRYDSHPEIAVDNAWSPEKLRAELKKMRALGIEPIPKLNFSTAHDFWMGEYARMVSTSKYYEVCRDLIREVSALFDTPRFFHIGMDEETCAHQGHYEYTSVRNGDLWWRDLFFYIDEVEKSGSRSCDVVGLHVASQRAVFPENAEKRAAKQLVLWRCLRELSGARRRRRHDARQ